MYRSQHNERLNAGRADRSYGTAEIADHTIALALSLRRGIIVHHDAQLGPNPGWTPLDGPVAGEAQLIQRCKGRTWAIIGLGRIGTAVALRAKVFGFHVGLSSETWC